MSTLQPLKKRLQRTFTNLTNTANDLTRLLDNNQQSDVIADELELLLPKLAETILRLKQSTSRAVSHVRELKSLEGFTDNLADTIMMIDNLELVDRLDYIKLARLLGHVHPDLLAETFNELATYENGWQVIELVQVASLEKLTTRRR